MADYIIGWKMVSMIIREERWECYSIRLRLKAKFQNKYGNFTKKTSDFPTI